MRRNIVVSHKLNVRVNRYLRDEVLPQLISLLERLKVAENGGEGDVDELRGRVRELRAEALETLQEMGWCQSFTSEDKQGKRMEGGFAVICLAALHVAVRGVGGGGGRGGEGGRWWVAGSGRRATRANLVTSPPPITIQGRRCTRYVQHGPFQPRRADRDRGCSAYRG